MSEEQAAVDVQENPTPTAKVTRLRWQPMKKPTGVGSNYVYPFADKSNLMDIAFIRAVLLERPYRATYAHVGESWTRVIKALEKQKDCVNQPIFPPGISTKTL